MPGQTAPRKTGRGYARNLDAGPFQPMVGSFELHLRAEKKSPKTIRTYLEAALWFAAEYLIGAGLSDWSDVKARHVQEGTVTLLGRYSDAYASNQFRALQQFFRWHATEDPDEPRPNPVAGLSRRRSGTICARSVRFTYDTSRALDRYIRERAKHRLARVRGGPMTASGSYQVITRRGRQCGVAVFPHLFRHHFSHSARSARAAAPPAGCGPVTRS
jgi:site-specific recombinase XerD